MSGILGVTSLRRQVRAPAAIRTAEPEIRPLGLAGRIGVILLVVPAPIIGIAGGYGALAAAPYAVVGGFLAIRRPGNSIGWLLIGLGWAFAVSFINVPGSTADLLAGTAAASVMAIAILIAWAGGALLMLFFIVTIVFPSGHLPIGRWAGLARLVLAVDVLLWVVSAFGPTISVNVAGSSSGVQVQNPLAVLPDSVLWSVISAGAVLQFSLVIVGVGSMIVRLRRAHGVERAQLRWVVMSLALILVGFVIGLVGDSVFDNGLGGLVWIPAEIAFVLPPIAIGIAILRYRLYEIDRIVSRTIGYGTVTAVLVVTFAGAILLFQAVLAPLTGGNTLAVAASTLVVAALFQPLRRRVQARVDRRFNRSRYDAERTLAAFAGGLRDEVDLGQLTTEIGAAIDKTVQPVSVSIWLRIDRNP